MTTRNNLIGLKMPGDQHKKLHENDNYMHECMYRCKYL